MQKMLSITGIILNTAGTLSTLWTVFKTKSSMVGTAWEWDHRPEEAPKEKRRVVVGFVLIVAGNLLQIMGMYIT